MYAIRRYMLGAIASSGRAAKSYLGENSMNPERFAGLVAVLVFNAALSSASIADEAGVLAMAPWSGSAEVFRTGGTACSKKV